MKELCDKVDAVLFGLRDEGTAYMSSPVPMCDPYTHRPMCAVTMTYKGKTYEIVIKECVDV